MTEPQLSPGGEWWWTGDAWVAAADHPDGRAAMAARSASAVPEQVTAPEPLLTAVAAPAPAAAAEPASVLEPAFAAPVAPVAAEPFTYTAPASGSSAFGLPAADPVWAPAAAQPVTAAPAGAAPFDTLGLVSILCNLFPFFALGQIAAVLVANKADRDRAKQGYPGSSLAKVGRALGWVFGVLIWVGIALAVALPLFLSHHRTPLNRSTPPLASQAVNDAALANIRAAATVEATYHQQYGIYTGTAGLAAHGFAPTGGANLVVLHADRTRYCMRIELRDAAGWFDSRTGRLSPRPTCS